MRGYSFQMNRSTGPAKTATGFTMPPVRWGQGHHAEFAERFGKSSLLAAIVEDLPEEHNRVDLDPRLTDSQRHRRAQGVLHGVGELGRGMIEHAVANGEKVMRAAGAHTVMSTPLLRGGGWHLMGTARMGDDPKRSVVDAQRPGP